MHRTFSHASLCYVSLAGAAAVASLLAVGCSAAPRDDEGTTSSAEAALSGGDWWERSVECDGAHFDRHRLPTSGQGDPNQSYMDGIEWQLVITDPGAVGYLNAKIEEQKHSPIGLNQFDASNRPHGNGEIVIWLGQVSGSNYHDGARQSQWSTYVGLGSNEGTIDVVRSEWFQDQGNGNYRKNSDVKVTYNHNGWSDPCVSQDSEWHCYQYASGGTDPKPGWSPYEISNWVFRGCRNL